MRRKEDKTSRKRINNQNGKQLNFVKEHLKLKWILFSSPNLEGRKNIDSILTIVNY